MRYVIFKKWSNRSGIASAQYGASAERHCEAGTEHVRGIFPVVFKEGANTFAFKRIYSPTSAIKHKIHFPLTE